MRGGHTPAREGEREGVGGGCGGGCQEREEGEMIRKGERRKEIKGDRNMTAERGGERLCANDNKQDEAEERDNTRSGETGNKRLGEGDGDRSR